MNPSASQSSDSPVLGNEHPLQQAGLQHWAHTSEQFQLALLTNVTLLRLHTLQPREELATRLQGSGMELPGPVNACAGQDPSVLCLAPAEWLVFSEYLSTSQLLPVLQAAIDPERTALLDQTAAFAVFRLGGPVAPWLLSKCGGLDWQSGMAGGPHCCRTLLEQLPAIVHYHPLRHASGAAVFDVMLDRSLARHGWQLFLRNLPHARQLLARHGPLESASNTFFHP